MGWIRCNHYPLNTGHKLHKVAGQIVVQKYRDIKRNHIIQAA